MGGIAALAKSLGHTVTGSDANVYPPMSTQLENLGITLTQGYDPEQLTPRPDLVIIGNAMSRGNPAVEHVLNQKIPYISGPQWLLEQVLQDKWVLAVSGTHGKTTTSSMLAWILDYAGMQPGFLIGGVPENFGCTARLGDSVFFVIEADEYDSAFFDKRSKFVHYRPNTLVINNLEFDHADIFNSIDDIKRQFHHLVRMVPNNGLILSRKQDTHVKDTLEMGCWSEQEYLGDTWQYRKLSQCGDQFEVRLDGQVVGNVQWSLIGEHNIANGMMAIAAARHVGVKPETAIEALGQFVNVKRRMELKATIGEISIYDDFAHHPTAIKTSLSGMREKVGDARIIAVIEPRSNTMKMGYHKETLSDSWQDADEVYLFSSSHPKWLEELSTASQSPVKLYEDITLLIQHLADQSKPGDNIIIMSNGGFENIHQKLASTLEVHA